MALDEEHLKIREEALQSKRGFGLCDLSPEEGAMEVLAPFERYE